MIVQESDILLAALDRRLQVDRVLALDPLTAAGRSADAPRGPRDTAPAGVPSSASAAPADLAARLPLGQVIVARVVEVPQPGHVVADFGSLRIAMAWPAGSGVVPRPGSDIALRVLAHEPMLLFQSADAADERPGEAATRWSSDTLSLQRQGRSPQGAGPTRFDIPILEIEIVPIDEASPHAAQSVAPRPPAHESKDPDATARSASMIADGHATIALDDVIVGHRTALVDGVATALIPKINDELPRGPSPFMPLVLQGPAWPGQPMEFVVHREREDEQLDNPVLDHWCGEVVIDLPHLGRVAGHLAFSMQGLRIRLEGDDAATVSAMTAASAELATAFAGVDLRVAALSVGLPTVDASRPGPGVARATFGIDDHG